MDQAVSLYLQFFGISHGWLDSMHNYGCVLRVKVKGNNQLTVLAVGGGVGI